ncbi:putative ferric-chelate reductase 1 [Apostichopus japonicus]|uniref:putative ferric-chelate reductase 1 n=1 Tax=Stichopus japonicus TaxID=307972 RepID=UPI003AB3787C
METIRLVLVLVGFIGVCQGYGSGAPPVACEDMTPGHVLNGNDSIPLSPSDEPSPFTVTVSEVEFGQGGQVEVTIQGSVNFAGFLLQARQDGEDEPVGTFSDLASDMKFVECSATYTEAAVTHTNSNPFDGDVTVTWTAPSTQIADVTFYATVASDHDNYWVMLESEKIIYSGFSVLYPKLCMVLLPMVAILNRFLG